MKIQCADSTLRGERLYGVEAHHFTSGKRIAEEEPSCLSSRIREGRQVQLRQTN